MEKVSIATCNGMSALSLIGRATCNDLATENDDIISICITATAADNGEFIDIIKKYPIIAINGCSDSCVNKIIKSKGVKVEKSFPIDKFLEKNNLKAGDPSRLDEDGEESVKQLKAFLKEKIESMK